MCIRDSYGGVWIEMRTLRSIRTRQIVTPYGGVWIEMNKKISILVAYLVTPYGGVWIEISTSSASK